MLTKVILVNFQAHKHLEVDCAGFTTLTGGSNGGKSAVLRAIHGLVRNDSAADYVRHGQKTLSVTLQFSDGYSVEWIKGSGENKYILIDPENNRRLFDKVGSDVPEEVKQVLRLGPIAVKGSDKEYVNFHNQLESPFLISATPGAVAKLFGELTSASDLYSAVSEGNRQVRSTGALKTTRKADVDRVKASLSSYDDLDTQVTILAHGKNLFDKANILDKNLQEISKIKTNIERLTASIENLECLISELQDIETIDIDTLRESAQHYVGIQSIVSKSKKFDEYEVAALNLVSELEKTTEVDLSLLEKEATYLAELTNLVANLKKLGNDINVLNSQIQESKNSLNLIEQNIVNTTAMLDACAECGQQLTEEAKLALIEGVSEHAAC